VASMARGLAQQLVVRSHITSTEQLKGARWAVDGIGALSHNMARLVVHGLNIPDEDIKWDVAGPPPERIAKLIAGDVDCALVRVEEATALVRDNAQLKCLLGFDDLKRLAPLQPHGVLSTTEAFENSPKGKEVLKRLVRGLVLTSRALHDDVNAFKQAVKNHVTHVKVSTEEVQKIWEQEHNSGGFAVNGALSQKHWNDQFGIHYKMNPACAKTTIPALISDEYLQLALQAPPSGVGVHSAAFDRPDLKPRL